MLCCPRTRPDILCLPVLCPFEDWFLALAVARPFAFSVLIVVFDPLLDLALPLVGARCTRDANAGDAKRAAERIIATVERDKYTIKPPQESLMCPRLGVSSVAKFSVKEQGKSRSRNLTSNRFNELGRQISDWRQGAPPIYCNVPPM